ncbi:hypothetical protein TNIN_230381 [Trichonephila inaurata madagascariensis]|uniref:Uncharacterized protein n=1 Tax=Trichonephila inaurata madagascariensis TaxID=2747483 RepID=A0A8X6WPV0_9ARAC|nr:hypothetical protein TNIN_230381 [Trichonephila inaurata madagascariensis]
MSSLCKVEHLLELFFSTGLLINNVKSICFAITKCLTPNSDTIGSKDLMHRTCSNPIDYAYHWQEKTSSFKKSSGFIGKELTPYNRNWSRIALFDGN